MLSVPAAGEAIIRRDGASKAWGTIAKLLGVVVIAGGGVAFLAGHAREAAEPLRSQAGTSQPTEPSPTLAALPTPGPSQESLPAVTPPQAPPRLQGADGLRPGDSTGSAAGAAGRGPGGGGGSVAAEVALLRKVGAALRSGDAKGALVGVEEHARRFPNGALSEERDMERIVALCALDRRPEAARARDRFQRAYPASSHETRIRAACDGPASSGVAP